MGIRVLIAEDHTMVRQGLRALLDREGFDVVGEVSNGHEAVESSAEADPDVVVMDISMPVMNGVDAAQELSQRQPKAKAVLTINTCWRLFARARAATCSSRRRRSIWLMRSGRCFAAISI